MKPVLKYRGGKSKELCHFLKHIPKSYTTYIEPFVGGGALYFHLEPQRAIINDINTKLITFYHQLKYQYHTLVDQLAELQDIYEKNQIEYEKLKAKNPDIKVENKNEQLYYSLRNIFNYPNENYLAGTIYYFINKTSYGGMIRYNKKGEYNVPFGRYKNFNTKIITEKHHHLLANTDIHCADYSEIFNMATERDFMFLDPPYDCIFNDYGNLELEDGFNEMEHKRLASDFRNLGCPTLMVISKTPLTESLYRDYIVDEYHKSYAVNIRNRFKNEAKHIIIKNYR
ncbi:Dam family site-specific DNA-(adenine-N6)-methyltransferase [Peptococcaceae bacterium 1198_IL3148]